MIFPCMTGTLFAAVFDSPVAHGKIKRWILAEAEKMQGVVEFLLQKIFPVKTRSVALFPMKNCWQKIMFIFAECRLHWW